MNNNILSIYPQLDAYITLLKQYNEHTNIYSQKAYDKLPFHLQDCAQLAEMIGNKRKIVLDMGSGSGLPSLVIALINPANRLIAVESRKKKADFLKWAGEELGLDNFGVVNMDLNEFAHLNPDQPDVITAKAFAPYEKAQRIAKKLAKPKTTLLMPISADQAETLNKETTKPFTIINSPTDSDFFYLKEVFK